MTPRVNLLPPEFAVRAAERRYAYRSAGGLAVLLLVLALVTALQGRQLGAAEARRDAQQAELSRQQGRRAELAEFGELADRLEARNALTASAMAREIAWATVLTDLAATLPPDASLTSLSAEMAEAPAAQPPAAAGEPPADGSEEPPAADPEQPPAAGPEQPPQPSEPDVVARLSLSGYSIEGVSPGVATVLRDVEAGPRFATPVLADAAADEIGTTEVTTFQSTVPLHADAYTYRYREPPDDVGEAGEDAEGESG